LPGWKIHKSFRAAGYLGAEKIQIGKRRTVSVVVAYPKVDKIIRRAIGRQAPEPEK